jgi:hypothetical protein
MDGVVGQVEDIYQEGGGVILDRGGNVDWLDRVRKLEEELDRLRQVFHLVGGRLVWAVPVGTNLIDKREARRSGRRATASRPDMSVKRGERILIRLPKTAGIEAARRKWIFCCLSLVRRGGEDAVVRGAGPSERSSRCCEVSWYMRPTATQEVGMSMRIS